MGTGIAQHVQEQKKKREHTDGTVPVCVDLWHAFLQVAYYLGRFFNGLLALLIALAVVSSSLPTAFRFYAWREGLGQRFMLAQCNMSEWHRH